MPVGRVTEENVLPGSTVSGGGATCVATAVELKADLIREVPQ